MISAIHSNTSLALCCAASQPYANPYEMRADELRYSMFDPLCNEIVVRAADDLASHGAWKSGEGALVHATIQRQDGRWVP